MSESSLAHELRQESGLLIEQLQESLAAMPRDTDQRLALPPGTGAALTSLDEALPKAGCDICDGP